MALVESCEPLAADPQIAIFFEKVGHGTVFAMLV